MPTLVMGLCALGIMFSLRKFMPKMPNVLIAVVVTTVAAYAMGFVEMGGKVVGEVPKGLPSVKMPSFDLDMMLQLSSAAVTIALIGFMEAIAIAKAMAASTRQRLDTNQELVGQGFANIAAGFFQSYPVSGSFSRSAVNFSAGAVTGFSSIVTGIVVAITLLFLTPLLYNLPQATLAAIIVMAVINLVKIEPIKHAMKVQKHDGVIAIITFALTLIVAPHLEKAIVVGVVLSLGLYLYRTMHPRFAELGLHPDGTLRDVDVHDLQRNEAISVLRFDGSLYFANAGYFEDKVLANVTLKPKLKYVIIDAEGINQIDATGEEMLHVLSQRLKVAGIQLMIARAKKQLVDIFRATHFVDHLGEQYFFRTRTDAIHHARAHLGDKIVGETALS